MARVIAVLAAIAALALPSIVLARSLDETKNNYVQAQTSTGGAKVLLSSTQVAVADGETVDNQNVAFALSSDCSTPCYTSAVAVQVVLVAGSPSTFAPQNVALAVNSNCTGCGAYAYAWQYVAQTDKNAHLTGKARHEIDDLSRQIDQLTRNTTPVDFATDNQLTASLKTLTGQIKTIVDSDLRSNGHENRGREHLEIESD
jgi:hypothetical protein